MGLIGGMARTAVVAGTATAVSNRVSRRQARRWSAEPEPGYSSAPPPDYYSAPPPPPPPPAAPPVEDPMTAKLQNLAHLRDQGVLSEDEFVAAKARLLGI